MQAPLYPSLFQINTRVWLTELSQSLGRTASLDDVPESELDRIAALGFDWVWLLSVWQTGLAGRQVSRSDPQCRKEFQATLPDLTDDDIPGSGFAITAYTVHASLGGNAALARLRDRLHKRGLKLMLDFVPNHTGLDHPWVEEHPDYYIRGTKEDVARIPVNYTRTKTNQGELVFAHGRDPHFPGWRDTLQINYSNPVAREAMIAELLRISGKCDGVRCDMAMLVLPEVFQRTWGLAAESFWPEATRRVRENWPNFCFMAEVYWDLEWEMLQQGFDYAYDKRLYDRLRAGHALPVREHLMAGLDFQNKLARFLENHDEPRAAAAFPAGQHDAAAVITFLAPGLRFFHQGQFEGRLKHISPHLGRAPDEPVNTPLKQFYERLLSVVRRSPVRRGQWRLLECIPAWEENGSSEAFIAFSWNEVNRTPLLVTVNYSARRGQCYVRLPFSELGERRWRLRDLLSGASYERDGNELLSKGLYLDVPPWHYHAFEFEPY